MTQKISLPDKVVDSDWKDDIDYESYDNEKTYISPESIKKETLAKIKNSSVKLAIRNLVNWDRVKEKVLS